ncbi:putative glycoside hydrolase superfamily [Plasmopara halstedii]
MVYAGYKSMFAMMAAMAINSADSVGVCYAPWRLTTVTEETIKADIQIIGQYFTSFRTFEVRMGNYNIIDIAASVGVTVSVGVQMNDLTKVDAEIQAVCDGYGRNPSAVDAIWVGNENLQNGGFGTASGDLLVSYIKQIRECTGGRVDIGSVQRIGEWLTASDANKVAQECDRLGVNIYPFFTQGEMTPVQKLEAQWQQMLSKYDAAKLQLTETGWPTEGEVSYGNSPSLEIMQQYLQDFTTWVVGKKEAYWFMMFDTSVSYSGQEFEKHFGVCKESGEPKVTIPDQFKIITTIVGGSMNTTEGNIEQTEVDSPMEHQAENTTTTPPTESNVDPPALSPSPTTPTVMLGEPMMRNPDGSIVTPTPTPPTFLLGDPVYFNPDGSVADPPLTVMLGEPMMRNADGSIKTPTSTPPTFMLGDPVYFNPDGSIATPNGQPKTDDKSKKDCPM